MREYIDEMPRLQAQRTLHLVYAFRLANADPEDREVAKALQELQDAAAGITAEEKPRQAMSAEYELALLASMGGSPMTPEMRARIESKNNG